MLAEFLLTAALQAPEPGLFRVRGEWEYQATRAHASLTVLVPLPLAYREQVPVQFELEVGPPAALTAARVYEDRPGNWVAELQLGPLAADERRRCSWIAWVLAGERSFADLPKKAPLPAQWPAEAQPWLRATRYAEAEDPAILAAVAEIRRDGGDVRQRISAVLETARAIYAGQEGRCAQLGAVEALRKEGSCTSAANLVAALLRASGVPARIVAGYATWYGPHQTHYIVEAYVPEYGWYPLESTRTTAGWQPYQQIQVAIVPPEYEDRGWPRFFAAGGVPYLSLTEVPGLEGGLSFRGLIEPGRSADHVAEPVKPLKGSPGEWEKTLEAARAHWAAWLASAPKAEAGRLACAGPKGIEKLSLSQLRAALR